MSCSREIYYDFGSFSVYDGCLCRMRALLCLILFISASISTILAGTAADVSLAIFFSRLYSFITRWRFLRLVSSLKHLLYSFWNSAASS